MATDIKYHEDLKALSKALDAAEVKAEAKALSELCYEMAQQLYKANTMLANHKLNRTQARKEHHKNEAILTKYKRQTGNWAL